MFNENKKPRTLDGDTLLKLSQAQDFLQISRQELYRLRKSGKLPVVERGKFVRIWQSDLEAYLEKLTKPARHREFR